MTLVRIARVLGTFGVKGHLKLESSTDHPEWIATRPSYILADPRSNEFINVRVVEVGSKGRELLIRLEGYDSPEELKQFNGWELMYPAERGELPREPGEVFYFELPGLEVRDLEGIVLGVVLQASDSGAHTVLEISGGYKQLIPFTEQFVPEVNLAEGYLVTTYPLEPPIPPSERAHRRRRK